MGNFSPFTLQHLQLHLLGSRPRRDRPDALRVGEVSKETLPHLTALQKSQGAGLGAAPLLPLVLRRMEYREGSDFSLPDLLHRAVPMWR